MSNISTQWKKVKRSGTFGRKFHHNLRTMSCVKQKQSIFNIFTNKDELVCVTPSIQYETNEQECSQPILEENMPQVEEAIISVDSLGYNSENDGEIEEVIMKKETILLKLRNWSATFNIRHTAIKELMKIVNFIEPGLVPNDPRTLLQTPVAVVIKTIGDHGKYWHQGLFLCLQETIRDPKQPMTISLNINIDGLPIAKSSRYEFWPILCNIYEFPKSKPMVIGIYFGIGKPALTQFLQSFVDELKVVMTDGIYLNGHLFNIKVRAFICDSPARAFIKGTANFNSQNGCLKCHTVGEYSYESRTNIFPRTQCAKRSDKDFRAKTSELHHKCTTPLEHLDIDMIETFPVSDSLHLLDLGIMKRCLLGWRDGTFKQHRTKWSAKEIEKLSFFLSKCKMPIEIHRAVRGLDCLSHWKATEYRTFFYYIGIVILKDNLPTDVYAHFLMLFCAVTICSSVHYVSYIHVAERLMEDYVERYRDIYGKAYMTSNVHNLIHMVDEVRRFGPLATFNAYPFENMLYQIKLLLRHGNKPLVQVANRIYEINQCRSDKEATDQHESTPTLKNPINNYGYYSKLDIADAFSLTTSFNNRWILTNQTEIIQFTSAFKAKDGQFYIKGRKVKNMSCFFENPFRSSFLFIYECCVFDLEVESIYKVSEIKCKMVPVIYDDTTTVFLPLIHTLS